MRVQHLDDEIEDCPRFDSLAYDTQMHYGRDNRPTAARVARHTRLPSCNYIADLLLPAFEAELANFERNIEFLKKHGNQNSTIEVLNPVQVAFTNKVETYSIKKGEKVFSDQPYLLGDFAEELKNLRPLRFSLDEQSKNGTSLTFTSKEAVNVIVGYLNTERKEYAKAPTLETDASANQFGQGDVKIANAIDVPGRASVNIHTYTFPAGTNTLSLGKGGVLILGFTSANQKIAPRNAGIGGEGESSKIDWLFY